MNAPVGQQAQPKAPAAVETPSKGRTLMLVVGSGRSGTSLFTGIMQRLGFHVPQPEVTADSTNPRGFAEPKWVVDFHTALLGAGRRAGCRRAAVRLGARPPASPSTTTSGGSSASGSRAEFAKSDHVDHQGPAPLVVPARSGASAARTWAPRRSS